MAASTSGGPICPYCEKWWSDGPAVQETASELRIVSCPHCRKVVAVLPVSIYAIPG